MKKVFFIFLLATQALIAQSGFEAGNRLYRAEKYAEAVTEFENVLKTKKHSAELYFNLANAYYKMNKVAPAVYNFEKALLLAPDDRDIQTNLKFARKMMIDEAEETQNVGFQKFINDFTSVFSYDAWAWISVGLSVTFLLFFIGYYFSGRALRKRIFFIGMFALIFLMGISILSAAFGKERYANEKPAIVFAGIVSIKSEPKKTASDVIILHEGTKVYIIETLDDWKRVQLENGADGWIETSAIKEIK